MIRSLVRNLAVAVAAAAAAGSASADFVIDTFAAPNPGVNYQITAFNSNPWDRTDAIAGGLSRATHVEVTSPIPPQFNAVGGTLGGGSFSVDSNNATTAFATLTYNGFTSTTGNFSGTNGIQIAFINLNPGNVPSGPVAADMPVTFAIATVSGTLTYTAHVTGYGLPFTVNANYNQFSGTGDLSHVTSVKISLNTGSDSRVASDYILDEIKTTTVPAPPAVFLAAAALPVFGVRRWFAKRKATAAG